MPTVRAGEAEAGGLAAQGQDQPGLYNEFQEYKIIEWDSVSKKQNK